MYTSLSINLLDSPLFLTGSSPQKGRCLHNVMKSSNRTLGIVIWCNCRQIDIEKEHTCNEFLILQTWCLSPLNMPQLCVWTYHNGLRF